MARISTVSTYNLALNNLSDTQSRQLDAARQVSSQKNAQDLKGYAGRAESLTAMNAVQSRITGLLNQNAILTDRFTTQDVALNQLSDSAASARAAIADALSNDRADTLMQEMRGFFTNAAAALNTKSQGRYIFAGGQFDTPPVSTTAMSDLTASPIASLFKNDNFIVENQIDETSTIQGGMLADDLGTDLFDAFKDVQTFNDGAGQAFTGPLTAAQRTFLEGVLAKFETAHNGTINNAARNGSLLRRLDDTAVDLTARSNTLETLVGNITDVDMPSAISRLQAAELAVQASAQVFNVLRDSSLLNFLRI